MSRGESLRNKNLFAGMKKKCNLKSNQSPKQYVVPRPQNKPKQMKRIIPDAYGSRKR